ncbi:MAG: hypothetical protein WCA12_07935, partial [Burkholderiales bacterium]
MQAAAAAVEEHRLTLAEVLPHLVADGLVTREDADRVEADRRLQRNTIHPLVALAEQKWRH